MHQGNIKNNQTKFHCYDSSHDVSFLRHKHQFLQYLHDRSIWSALQCLLSLGQLQNLGNSSSYLFILYRETMPPQTTREQVKILLLPQINFQWIKLSFCLQIYTFFSFFSKMSPPCIFNVWLTLDASSSLCKYTKCTGASYNVWPWNQLISWSLVCMGQYNTLLKKIQCIM